MRPMLPQEIEAKSFSIIERRVPRSAYPPDEWLVVAKVIHATADFTLRRNVHIGAGAIDLGVRNLLARRPIFTDVCMVGAGISRGMLKGIDCDVLNFVNAPEAGAMAARDGITRSQAAVRIAVERHADIGIFAIGNAPTALFEILRLAKDGRIGDALVIGACVGMVGAAESKAALLRSGMPCIAIKGKRGGSPIAATIVNALLKIAKEARR